MSSSGNEMVLKCDLHEALIDPMTLLSGEYFVSIACIIMIFLCWCNVLR